MPSKRVTLSQVVKAMGRANHMHVRQLARLFELFEHHRNGPPRRKVAP